MPRPPLVSNTARFPGVATRCLLSRSFGLTHTLRKSWTLSRLSASTNLAGSLAASVANSSRTRAVTTPQSASLTWSSTSRASHSRHKVCRWVSTASSSAAGVGVRFLMSSRFNSSVPYIGLQ